MERVTIREHLWKDGGCVGIASHIKDDIEVTIESTDKEGKILYPHIYRYSKDNLLQKSVEQYSKGCPVRVIRIREMEINTSPEKEHLIELFNGKEVDMDFDLSNYKPEKVKDNDFEVFTGKGFICKVNSAKIEDVEAGENDRGSYEGYTRLRYELEIISDKNKGRKLWKSYNLSSKEETGKAKKTPIQKLADAFFTIGLEFSDRPGLDVAIEKFAELELVVSCSKFKPKGGDTLQLHTMTAVAPARWEEEQPVQEKEPAGAPGGF